MFFKEDKMFALRRMILARNDEERKEPLKELLRFQKADFKVTDNQYVIYILLFYV